MEDIIANLGFPIACCVGMGVYFIRKDQEHQKQVDLIINMIREDNREDREMYKESVNNFNDKLDKFALAIENNNNRLYVIEEDVQAIKEKVGNA